LPDVLGPKGSLKAEEPLIPKTATPPLLTLANV